MRFDLRSDCFRCGVLARLVVLAVVLTYCVIDSTSPSASLGDALPLAALRVEEGLPVALREERLLLSLVEEVGALLGVVLREEWPLLSPLEEVGPALPAVVLREERPLFLSLEEVGALLAVVLREERPLLLSLEEVGALLAVVSPLEGVPLFDLDGLSLLDFDILDLEGEEGTSTSSTGTFGLGETTVLLHEDPALDSSPDVEDPVTIGKSSGGSLRS